MGPFTFVEYIGGLRVTARISTTNERNEQVRTEVVSAANLLPVHPATAKTVVTSSDSDVTISDSDEGPPPWDPGEPLPGGSPPSQRELEGMPPESNPTGGEPRMNLDACGGHPLIPQVEGRKRLM